MFAVAQSNPHVYTHASNDPSARVFSEGPSPHLLTAGHPADHNSRALPVIVLFLVTEKKSKDKHPFLEHNYLRYFRKIYESRGWTTLECTTTDDVTTIDSKCEQTAQSMMAAIESHSLHENPIFLHLLGHHSIPLYNEFTKAVESETDDVFRIRGTIIDSGPSRPQGFLVSLRKAFPTLYNIVIVILHLMSLAFPEIFTTPSELDAYDCFCYNKCPSPQLFLYSTSDHLVDSSDVESAINIRHQAGIAVDKRCWADSEHARHLFTHEHEYTALCQQFVERNCVT